MDQGKKEIIATAIENGVREIVIREDNPKKVYEEIPLSLSGNIESPRVFLEKRGALHDEKAIHVLVNREARTIKAVIDERQHFSTIVSGKISSNKDLEEYGINQGKQWSLLNLQSFLKLRRIDFETREQNMQIVSNLGQFRANVNTEIQRMKDDRGNKKEMIETQIVTGLEMSFNLRMPVFKGSKPLIFRVDLCFEIRDSAVSVWMESPELAELTQDEVNRVIDEEVKFFQNYVVIEQ